MIFFKKYIKKQYFLEKIKFFKILKIINKFIINLIDVKMLLNN